MAKILFAWELGGGMGHVAKHLPVIDGLRRLGHEAAFAMRNLRFAETLLGEARIPYFQAPVMLGKPADEDPEPYTFAQILHNVGYGDVELVTSLARGWRQLYECYRPDLIVFDHSPTALLAARGFGARRVVTGVGFCVPPDTAQPLALRPEPPPSPERIARDEARILGNINRVLARLACAPVERVTQIYQADEQVLRTFRELDQVRERQQQEDVSYWGVARSDTGVSPRWPEVAGPRIFAYLKPFKTLPSLLETLRKLGHPTLIYAPELNLRLKQQFGGPSLLFSDRRLDMAQTVATAELAITNAGHGTTADLLLGGVPQLLLPLHLEQRLTADNVQRLGAGLSAPALHPQGMALKLEALLSDGKYRAAAKAFAQRHSAFNPIMMEQLLLERFDRLLK